MPRVTIVNWMTRVTRVTWVTCVTSVTDVLGDKGEMTRDDWDD